ncbi:MAG: LptF/LptG family permease [Leptospirales bacterium]|nr:LptF/LptG family permease [Leptospirales bacterium]
MFSRFSILDRYLFFEFLKSFAFALTGLAMMWLTFQALDTVKVVTRAPRYHIYLYLLYSVPSVVAFVLPMAVMFSVCFVVSQFSVSRELVAIFSAGVSFYRAVAPIWIFAGGLVITLFLFQNFVVTPSNRLAAEEQAIFKKDTATVKDLVWQRNLRGREGYYFIYYLDRKEKAIKGGFNYIQITNGKPIRMIQANSGQYSPETDSWLFKKVREIKFRPDIGIESIQSYDELTEKFPDEYDFFENPLRDPSELNVFELFREIRKKTSLGFTVTTYEVQFHSLIAFPFFCFIVAVIASVAGAGGSHRSAGPLVRALLLSVITILIYYLGAGLMSSMGNNGVIWPSVAAWTPTLGFLGAAAYLVWKNRK